MSSITHEYTQLNLIVVVHIFIKVISYVNKNFLFDILTKQIFDLVVEM